MKRRLVLTAMCLLVASAYAQDTLQTTNMNRIVVAARKSSVRLKADRKQYTISEMATSAGLSASEALESVPGVEVTGDGHISLRGNDRVEVWINGKSSGLTVENRGEVLQQLAAEDIDYIEVIDNPSARYAAEGTAGIINIVLRKERRRGYYGSAQAGVKTIGAAVGGLNLNYNSSVWDGFLNIGYRHRRNKGRDESEQTFLQTDRYQWYKSRDTNTGNSLSNRAGVTLHASQNDDITLAGTMLLSRRHNRGNATYHYGTDSHIGWLGSDERLQQRRIHTVEDVDMYYGELSYRHNFSEKHFLEVLLDVNRWTSDNDNVYQDSTLYDPLSATTYAWQCQTMDVHNRIWEAKIDYENALTDNLLVQSGYQGRFSHESTPQHTSADDTYWDGHAASDVPELRDRFLYDMDLHAAYAAGTLKQGAWNLAAGLRGEYWKVKTSLPYRHDYFQLFPSASAIYNLSGGDQLSLSYSRRIARPYGSQLNSFHDMRDATTVVAGNPKLTPEYGHTLQAGYLKYWTEHSILLQAYYRTMEDALQYIHWQDDADDIFFSTYINVPHSHTEGLELTGKNHLFRILDLTTTANVFHRQIGHFSQDVGGLTLTDTSHDSWSWNLYMLASLSLPYDISFQGIGYYHSREAVSQGYRKPNATLDVALRKNFLQKKLVLSINCHDVFSTRKLEKVHTTCDTFLRDQLRNRGSRKVNFTLTWNFGNTKAKGKAAKVEDPSDTYRGESDD